MSTDTPKQSHTTKAQQERFARSAAAGPLAAAALTAAHLHRTDPRYGADWYRQEIQRIERAVAEADCRAEYESALKLQMEQQAAPQPSRDELVATMGRCHEAWGRAVLAWIRTESAEDANLVSQRWQAYCAAKTALEEAMRAETLTRAVVDMAQAEGETEDEQRDPRGDFVELGEEIP